MRIAISINTSWNIFNFRMNMLRALQADGHQIICIAPEDAYSKHLVAAGFEFFPVQMENKGTNPVKDLLLVQQYRQIFGQARPDVVLQYTIKPNIYGTLAAKLSGIPVVNNVSGLGTVFIVKNLVSRVAIGLYKLAFRFAAHVFFQNEEDRELFLQHKLVRPEITEVLPGSGVDLSRFKPTPDFRKNHPFVFLMVARVLYEKGVVEYLEAAREIRKTHPNVEFQLLGGVDEAGNIGVKKQKLNEWVQEGAIRYLGTSDNVAEVITSADCVVLPSYREGTPKTLLEAAAMAKPIITTNVPGCKNTVNNGRNGYLCEVRSATDLARVMRQLLTLTDQELELMGRESRNLAESRFDEQIVIQKYKNTIARVTQKP